MIAQHEGTERAMNVDRNNASAVEPDDHFVGYLKTKKEKMGHLVSVA